MDRKIKNAALCDGRNSIDIGKSERHKPLTKCARRRREPRCQTYLRCAWNDETRLAGLVEK